MKNSNISVGLDIGTTKIVAMVGAKNEFNKVEILGVGKSKSLGVHRGVVNNITQTIQSINQAIEEAKTLSGEVIDEVVVGIAGQHIRSLQHSVARRDIRQARSRKTLQNEIRRPTKCVPKLLEMQKRATSCKRHYLHGFQQILGSSPSIIYIKNR